MPSAQPSSSPEYDVLIIGAGVSGVYSLYHIRKQFPSWRVKVIEAGADVGGTWYWNRYPGIRVDTESVSYAYSFDKELMNEWNWVDSFSTGAEVGRYIRHVAAKHDLYKDIQFNTRIDSAHWSESDNTWTFADGAGTRYTTRFFISCLGFLSSPTLPAIPGVRDFKGQSFHTSDWPKDLDLARDFANKRIGVIGTGASGIQTITAISKAPGIKSLTVFQRTANWCAPLRNTPITAEQMAQYRLEYDSILEKCCKTSSGFLHQADPRKSLEVTDEERQAFFEKLYHEPGFAKWLSVFSDTYTDRRANDMYSQFMASKIRERVHDPETAESLIPKNHGYGTRRVPLESGYLEAFNQDNVKLVDLKKGPIEKITETGISTADGKQHDLDVLIYATGFDAITGAFNAIEWHALDDRPLIESTTPGVQSRAIWPDHRPHTYLGVTVPAMPNMFMVLGPHQPVGNSVRSIEHVVEVISGLLQFCKDNQHTYVEATPDAAEEWGEHVVACSRGSLINEVDSWMTGVNGNVKGKTVKCVARYAGSAVEYRKRCKKWKVDGYPGLVFK